MLLVYPFPSWASNIFCISFPASYTWNTHNTLWNAWKKPVEKEGTFSQTLILSEDSGNEGGYEEEVKKYKK